MKEEFPSNISFPFDSFQERDVHSPRSTAAMNINANYDLVFAAVVITISRANSVPKLRVDVFDFQFPENRRSLAVDAGASKIASTLLSTAEQAIPASLPEGINAFPTARIFMSEVSRHPDVGELHQGDFAALVDANKGAWDLAFSFDKELAILRCNFAADRFQWSTVVNILEQISSATRQIACDAKLKVGAVAFEDATLGATTVTDPIARFPGRSGGIHNVFRHSALSNPHAVAVRHGEDEISYEELDAWADGIAATLANEGVSHGDRVAIDLDRSIPMVAAMLGVLKAGAAYVPLDSSAPSARRTHIVAQARLNVVISNNARLWTQYKMVRPDRGGKKVGGVRRDVIINTAPAYLLFTSGSTGTPKGVEVSHENVLRLFEASREHFQFSNDDVWLNAHSAAFDASVWEIFGALLHGATVVIVSREQVRDPERMAGLVDAEKVTRLTISPTAFEGFRDAAISNQLTLAELRTVVLCAEALNPVSLRRWIDRWGWIRPALVNMYGITETTVHSTLHSLKGDDCVDPRSKIGVGLADTPIYILDEQMRRLPKGFIGEIVVGGPGVSLGYVNGTDDQNKRFQPDPFSIVPGARMYRSGDLGRRLADGSIEFLGRIDQQVKIRGHRIELGEIQAVASTHPDVASARAFAIRSDNHVARLALVLVPRENTTVNESTIKEFLTRRLPDYMIPGAITFSERLPQTANGKLDSKLYSEEFARVFGGAAGLPELELVESQARDVLNCRSVKADKSFFENGGDSLTAVRFVAKIRDAGFRLSVSAVYKCKSLREIAFALQPGAPAQEDPLRVAAQIFPATRLQRGMLLRSELHPRSYHDVLSFTLDVPLVEQYLRQALDVVSVHETLRSAFEFSDDVTPQQRVHPRVAIPAEFYDVPRYDESALEQIVDRWANAAVARPFQLDKPGLLRVAVHNCGGSSVLSLSVHHLILDGWSVASLVTELLLTYSKLRSGEVVVAKPRRQALHRYAEQERAIEEDRQQLGFWIEYLDGAAATNLSPGLTHELVPQVVEHVEELPADTIERLSAIADEAGMPLKTIFFGIHAAVVSFLSGESEIVTGLIANGRGEEAGSDEELGLFLNTIPIRVRLGRKSFSELLQLLFEEEIKTHPYRRFPLERIQNAVKVSQLCSTAFNYTNFHIYERLKDAGVSLLATKYREDTEFNIIASVHRDPFGNGGRLEVRGALAVGFEAQALSYTKLFRSLCGALDAKSPLAIEGVVAGLAREVGLTAKCLSGKRSEYPSSVLAPLLESFAKNSGRLAVIFEGRSWTYAEILKASAQLRERLLGLGVAKGSRVGCFLERGVDPVICMIAIWSLGACYVPLDPDLPDERLRRLIQIANCAVIVASAGVEIQRLAFKGETVCVNSADGVSSGWQSVQDLDGCDEAYLLFTSGSTGVPKGVLMPHEALSNLVTWQLKQPEFASRSRVAQFAPLSFDVSIQEVVATLASGGTLCVVPQQDRRDPQALLDFLRFSNIEVVFLPPVVLEHLSAAFSALGCDAPKLKYVVTAGEALKITEEIREFCARTGAEIINQYGPTETHVITSFRLNGDPFKWPAAPPIGEPIDNVDLAILSPDEFPVSSLAAGNLMVQGCAVLLGYVTDAQKSRPLEASRQSGERTYLTGDIVKCSGSGFNFIGRADEQVKIRGHRVEPNEVAHVLRTHAGVSQCFVLPKKQNDRVDSLVAYVVRTPGTMVINGDSLKAYAADRLPAFAVPTAIQFLQKLPLNRNGKVDIQALPAPRPIRTRLPKSIVANEFERRILDSWAKILGSEVSSTTVSFFDAGGDSLKVLDLFIELRKHCDATFSISDIFRFPTVRQFAAFAKPSDINPC